MNKFARGKAFEAKEKALQKHREKFHKEYYYFAIPE